METTVMTYVLKHAPNLSTGSNGWMPNSIRLHHRIYSWHVQKMVPICCIVMANLF